MLIDGQWVESASGRRFETIDPATGAAITTVPHSDDTDVERAVAAARRAFEDGPWRAMTPAQRQRVLWRIGEGILARASEFAQLEIHRQRQVGGCRRGRRRRLVRRDLLLLRGFRHQDRGSYDPGLGALGARRQVPRVHAARTRRRVRPDHPVELPAADGRVQARPGTRLRQHRRAQARRADPADRPAARGGDRRGRRSGRSCQRAHRVRRRQAPRCPRTPTSTRSPSPVPPRSARRSSPPRPAT